MSTARGSKREHALGDRLEADGWFVVRSAGSHGPVDLTCLKAGERPMLLQVKSDKGNAYAHFPPRERDELRRVGKQTDADIWLVWWPPDRKPPRWIAPEFWP
jgi:Holliday junction resolvase